MMREAMSRAGGKKFLERGKVVVDRADGDVSTECNILPARAKGAFLCVERDGRIQDSSPGRLDRRTASAQAICPRQVGAST
jgi:hypothetical protein